jgi:hypothetical protein
MGALDEFQKKAAKAAGLEATGLRYILRSEPSQSFERDLSEKAAAFLDLYAANCAKSSSH